MNKNTRQVIEAVVFDMDGVLIDSEPVHYESTRLLFQDELGVILRESGNNEFLGSTDRHMFEVLRARYELSPTVDELIERRIRYRTQRKELDPLKGEVGHADADGQPEPDRDLPRDRLREPACDLLLVESAHRRILSEGRGSARAGVRFSDQAPWR